jgi:ADP-ribosylglycohydrolase
MTDEEPALWVRVLAAGDALGGVAHRWPRGAAAELRLDDLLTRANERGWRTSGVTTRTLVVARVAAGDQAADGLRDALARRDDGALPAIEQRTLEGWSAPSREAAREARESRESRDAASTANDALLVSLPLAAEVRDTTEDELADLAVGYVEVTHGRGRAAGAAAAFTLAAHGACTTGDPAAFAPALADALGHDAVVALLTPADAEALAAATAGAVEVGHDGVASDAVATLAAIVAVVSAPSPLSDAVLRAVQLGGETSTVAALAAGVLAMAGEVPDAPLRRAVAGAATHLR